MLVLGWGPKIQIKKSVSRMIFKILDTRSAKQSGKLAELCINGAVQRAHVSDMERMLNREAGFLAHGHRNSHARYKIETSSTQATGRAHQKYNNKRALFVGPLTSHRQASGCPVGER